MGLQKLAAGGLCQLFGDVLQFDTGPRRLEQEEATRSCACGSPRTETASIGIVPSLPEPRFEAVITGRRLSLPS